MNLYSNKTDTALFYLKLAEKVLNKTDFFGSCRITAIYGNLYKRKGIYKLAEKYFKRGIKYSDSTGEKINLIENQNGYSKLLLEINRLQEAKNIACYSLTIHHENFSKKCTLSIETTDILQNIYSQPKHFDSAYCFSNLRDIYKDSVYNENILNSIQDISLRKKIDATEDEIQRGLNK